MTRLSSKLSELKSKYTVVVVGSGYGGGIAASRMARAGQEVCVLERGREYHPGDFPDTELEALEQFQATIPNSPEGHVGSELAMFDFHVEPHMNVLRGCGLGGTSLINANVSLEADPKVFEDPRWPRELVADVDTRLREGYARARQVLEPTPYPADFPKLAKLEAHKNSAKEMGENWERAPLNVSFEERENPFGVREAKCTLCGDCVTGCNYGAKRTVDRNYIRDAWNHGADVFTEVHVDHVERRDDGLWAVHYSPAGAGREAFDREVDQVVLAEVVILGAGTLGSTEILLRSRERGLSTSAKLGHNFSGNADVLAFGYNNDVRINGVGAGSRPVDVDDPVGPTITSLIDGRRPDRELWQHFVIEEGALPGALDAIYPEALLHTAKKFGKDTDEGLGDWLSERGRMLRSRLPGGAYAGAVANTQTYLGMAHDSAAGELQLMDDRLRIHWPTAEREAVIARVNELLVAATKANGGSFVPNPAWGNHFDSRLITVHPLGGCPMAADASAGATNHKGQVFAGEAGEAVHEGLYVADGSVMPMALGVNPLLTISAVAERCVELLAEDRGWTIDYDLARPVKRRPPEALPGIGVRFTERMAGFISAADEGTSHEAAYAAGKAAGAEQAFSFVFTLCTDDLDACLDDPAHIMDIAGTVDAPSLSPEPLQAREARFHLLSEDPERLDTTNMIYEATLEASDGRRFGFRGVKYVHDDRGVDLWSDTTTLFVEIHEQSGALAARGLLHISPADFAKQLKTIDVTGTSSPLAKLQAKARFGRFFMGSLFDTYGDLFARPSVFDPDAPPRKRRALRVAAPEVHYFYTRDQVQLCLTRYKGGDKGPVVLAHGLGVSSGIFTVDTIDTNLVEFLFAHGYDLWLLDYRASIELAAAAQQANGDLMAQIDLPEAVAKVRALTGAPSVQMVVHCFGSTVFFMSMLSGALTHVRSAVASQATPHLLGSRAVRLKSGLHLPGALDALGVESLTAYTDTDSRWYEKLYDKALELYPTEREERCKSATCHRISFMYSLLYEHDQLAIATHDTLHELFGVASVEAFEHLAKMIRAKQVVDAAGEDVYLPHPRRLAIPLRIIHGAENACFLPEGSEQTYNWLREHNDPSLYSRVLIPDFGHIDCIFGKRAATAVYPHILEHLEATL